MRAYHSQCIKIIGLRHFEVGSQAVKLCIANVGAIEEGEQVEHRQYWQQPCVELVDELPLSHRPAFVRRSSWLRLLLGHDGVLPG